MPSPYETLGVDPRAGPDEVKSAYRRALLTAHPDRGGTEARFLEVQEAWALLSDPFRRALYDRTDGPDRPASATRAAGTSRATGPPRTSASSGPTAPRRPGPAPRGRPTRPAPARPGGAWGDRPVGPGRRDHRPGPGDDLLPPRPAGARRSLPGRHPSAVLALAGVLVVAAALALGSLPLGLLGVVAVAVGLVGTAGRPAARAGDPGVRALMEAVDRLSTTQYGALLSNLFTSLGYRVGRLVGPSAAGAELVLDRAGRRTVVHTGRRPVPVRREAVDKLASARDGAGAARALVVTTSAVTPKARTLAQRRRVEIWDRDRLARELARARRVPDPPPVQRLVAEVSAGLGRVGRGARSVASADRAGPR